MSSSSPDTATDGIRYDVADGIATIAIDRPHRLNAIDAAARRALFAAWRRFEADPAALVAILTATGERAFSVGRDLSEPVEGNFRVESFPILGVSVEVTKPAIAAVNGFALGGGFLFALMCDLCVAADTATFSIPEAKLGRGAAWAAPLMRLLPARVVMEMLVTAAPVSAARLHALGFVNAVVPLAELQNTAHRMAAQIARNAPLSVRACRRLARAIAWEGRTIDAAEAEAMFEHVYASHDAREGLAAFSEKRAPRWTAT
jgi:enoyl-CoA hydratase/carnithine racemase